MEYTLREKIWNGSLSVRIVLAPYELAKSGGTEELLINVSRISYFPLYMSRILDFFFCQGNDGLKINMSDWWLEFDSVPINWNWPIGLSYDILTSLDSSNMESESESKSPNPWTLVLHGNDYPVEQILTYTGESALKSFWLQQSKEACFIRDGNSKAILSLSKKDTDTLWDGVSQNNYKKFWTIMTTVLPNVEHLKSVPTRLYLPKSNDVLQKLVKVVNEQGEFQSVGSVLNQYLPELFPSKRTPLIARPVLHGILLPMSTPLAPLYSFGLYLDGFLHISIVIIT
ncbi:APG5-domain-containing protein [Nadsonia fulvescens var. elongata DSM 6958]|uniref:Autophagy protein 5 n=1 Tax=Nadsonia fulvescens var. elongata DSM 6958 TaxID=857566 RepID=A0A1E3PP17_9ASCO|nr:APG5-domain-containing protein [Nadsonia fulvescens var. elongata DSM 6958]